MMASTMAAIDPNLVPENAHDFVYSSINDQSMPPNVIAPSFLTEFSLFPKLPLELRRKIWQEGMPDARVIEVKFIQDGRSVLAKSGRSAKLPACQEQKRVESPRIRFQEGSGESWKGGT
jgi:hypothetical protein